MPLGRRTPATARQVPIVAARTEIAIVTVVKSVESAHMDTTLPSRQAMDPISSQHERGGAGNCEDWSRIGEKKQERDSETTT